MCKSYGPMSMIGVFMLILILLAYSPRYLFLFLSIFLVFLSLKFKGENLILKKLCAVIVMIIMVFTLAIHNLSFVNFESYNDDYISYYNNYLDFVDGYDDEKAFFNYGVEVFITVFNYIISLFVHKPEPYKVKFIYSLVLGGGLIFTIFKMAKFKGLDVNETILLGALILVFYKSNLQIQYSRQAFSSIFIILSIFSVGWGRILYLALALISHLSVVIIYPLMLLLFFDMDKKIFKKVVVLTILSPFVIFVTLISFGHLFQGLPLLGKLVYVLNNLFDPEMVLISLKSSLLYFLYIVPLLLVALYYRVKGCVVKFEKNIFLLLALLFSLSMFPGLLNRVLFPVTGVFLGYFYYIVLFEGRLNVNRAIKYVSIVFISIAMFLDSTYLGTSYVRFGVVGYLPFYYSYALDEVGYSIYRESLRDD